MIELSRDDIKFVACPTDDCIGDLYWADDKTIKCNRCEYSEVLERN